MVKARLWLCSILLLMAALLVKSQASAQDTTIRVSPAFKDASIKDLFRFIRNNTEFSGTYSSALTQHFVPFTCSASNIPLHKLLDTILRPQGLQHSFKNYVIRLSKRIQPVAQPPQPDSVRGTVMDEDEEPIGGVSVYNPKGKIYALTSAQGAFSLAWPPGSGTVDFSCKSYESKTISIGKPGVIQTVRLKPLPNTLNEVVVMPYHKIKRRNNTAAVDHISGSELRMGGVNIIKALTGKAPGLLVTESVGTPGAAIRVQIRGRQSIGTLPGVDNQPLNDPLLVLNQVPLIMGNRHVTRLPSAAGDPQKGGTAASGLSMQSAFNVEDVENIDVLKDADATTIYGSRGAQGAILLTTKQGKVGMSGIKVKVDHGGVFSTHQLKMLDNRQYVAMRREAMITNGLRIDSANAPDLYALDSNDYVNVSKIMTGGAGKYTNINLSFGGGKNNWRYYVSSGLYRESSTLPVDLFLQRVSNYGSLQYQSPDSNFRSDLFMQHSMQHNRSLAADPMFSTRVVPLLPALRDEHGALVFRKNGFKFFNPLSQFENIHEADMNVFITGWQLAYKLRKHFFLRANLGYQQLPVNEKLKLPRSAYDTADKILGQMWWGNSRSAGWIMEPQLHYLHNWNKTELNALLGATWQGERTTGTTLRAVGYPNDALLGSMDTAVVKLAEEGRTTRYRYYGVYARGNVAWQKRYFLNLSGRFDVSSRLGPRQGGFFGAVGAAWVFTQERWIKSLHPILSYGKLRASYGSGGNDNIDDYWHTRKWAKQNQVLLYDSLHATRLLHQQGVYPGWERNRKAEIAAELEFLESIFLTVAWYRNVTFDQLISVDTLNEEPLDGSRIINWPAKVLNTGWELQLRAMLRWNRKNSWNSTINFTIPRNKLLSFPGIEKTAYNKTLKVGSPLSIQQGYPFLGVDPAAGEFILPSRPPVNGVFDTTRIIAGHREPVYFASWYNECKWGSFGIAILLEARKQQAINPAYEVYAKVPPGRWDRAQQLSNQPGWLLRQRWQNPGDQAVYQRFMAAAKSATGTYNYFIESTQQLAHASFWRIRSVQVSWNLPAAWLQKLGLAEACMYIQGQNLFTFTSFQGDPTTQSPMLFPSLRIVTAGIQVNL